MPPRVKPYTTADLVQSPDVRDRRAHVGRILSPPVAAGSGEYLYRVAILAAGAVEPRVLPRVRELVSPALRSAGGRLGTGDVVLVQQLSRALWVIVGMAANPDEWADHEPAGALQSGDSGLLVSDDGWILYDLDSALRSAGGRMSIDAPALRIASPDLRVDGAGLRISKSAGQPLELWADAMRLRATSPWPQAALYRQLDIDLSPTGIRLSFDADVAHAGGRHFLAVIDADGWAAASAAHARSDFVFWGEIVDLLTGSIRPVNVSLVDQALTGQLVLGEREPDEPPTPTLPPPVDAPPPDPDSQMGQAIVQLATPMGFGLAVAAGRTDFSWGVVPDAGSYRMEWAVYDGEHVYRAGHPAIDSLTTPSLGFLERNRPPLLGLEKVFFDASARVATARAKIVDASALTPNLASGPAFEASMATALAQAVTTADGRQRSALVDDYARVAAFCWRVRARPDDITAYSESDFSDWHTTLHLQLLDGVEFV